MAIDTKTRAMVFYLSRLSTRNVAKVCNVSRTSVQKISKMGVDDQKCDKTQTNQGKTTKIKRAPGKKTTAIDSNVKTKKRELHNQEIHGELLNFSK